MLKRMYEWIKLNKHKHLSVLFANLNQKLRGHYGYYGITLNARRISSYYQQTKRMLHKWLNRRGGKRVWTWEEILKLTDKWIPLEKPRIYRSK